MKWRTLGKDRYLNKKLEDTIEKYDIDYTDDTLHKQSNIFTVENILILRVIFNIVEHIT